MPKLYEMVPIEKIADLVPDIRTGLKMIKEDRAQHAEHGVSQKAFSIPYEMGDDVGLPTLYYVHSVMWENASRDIPSNAPVNAIKRGYKRLYHGQVVTVTRKLTGDTLTASQATALGSSVAKKLRANGLIYHAGYGASPWWFIKEWQSPDSYGSFRPADLDGGVSKKKMDAIVKQQTDKHPPGAVVTSFDLSNISVPDPLTPQSTVKYIQKLTKATGMMQKDYDRVVRQNVELQKELDDMKGEETKEWREAGKQISDIVKK